MLKYDVRSLAVRMASRLIIKIARQIADSGYRSGQLKIVRGFTEGSEIELDHSLERYCQEPECGIFDNISSYKRERKQRAFVVMLDHSYSMKGLKIVLAAITAATIAQHFKTNYAVIAFSRWVSILKAIGQHRGPEEILERLFALELAGDTDVHLALEKSLQQIAGFDRKIGLVLTDGAWNQGGNPLDLAPRFDRLSVIGFPPAKMAKVRELALKGKGEFSFVCDEAGIAPAIIKCLR